jgi:tRNA modification GTPase
LVGFDRAIVADEPGTTRDVVAQIAAFAGWPVELLDGAGFREESEELETLGQRKLQSLKDAVDLRIQVIDQAAPLEAVDFELAERMQPHFIVANKADLPAAVSMDGLGQLGRKSATGERLVVSAATGEGLADLIDRMAALLVPAAPKRGEAVPFTQRHVDWLHSQRKRVDSSVV